MCLQYSNRIEILQDHKKSGKIRNWRGKKIGSWNLHNSYKRLGKTMKAAQVMQCGNYLDFKLLPDGSKTLYRANFCKDKLCPMCASRRSEKLYGQVKKIVDHIEERERYRYVFLTLTIRNVDGDELSIAIDQMFNGFNLLTKRKEFKALSKGWIRSLEITHNWGKDTYHPHIHLAIAVDERYFTEYENYLNHDEWKSLWNDCMSLDYDSWVFVEKVRKDRELKEKGTISYSKAISEITKYTSKSNDYLVKWKDRICFKKETGIELQNPKQCEEMTDRAVEILSIALYHRRIITFGGELRKVHKLLNLDDAENGDLINTDNSDDIVTCDCIIVRYRWDVFVKNYVLDKEFNREQKRQYVDNLFNKHAP